MIKTLTLLALAALPSFATLVTYQTAGVFSGGGTSVTFGSGGNTTTLTFTPLGASQVDTGTNFTFGSLGHIVTSATGTGATITLGSTLTINITQLVPPGTGSLGGILQGTISQNSSTADITFNILSTVIAGISYTIANNPLSLVPANTNGGVTTIQARISDDGNIPEPRYSFLIAGGLIALASVLRLRRT